MASKSRSNNPQDYTGARTVIKGKGTICGWCIDHIHQKCKHELAYYDKLWICSCDCNKDWVPQDLNNQEPMNGREENEVRTLSVPGDTGQPTEDVDPPGDLRESDETGSEDPMEELGGDSDTEA